MICYQVLSNFSYAFNLLSYRVLRLLSIVGNVLALGTVADFGALHCQPSTNFDRSTMLDLTTEPPLLGRCCCAFVFISSLSLYVHIDLSHVLHVSSSNVSLRLCSINLDCLPKMLAYIDYIQIEGQFR